jgi:hypothetical protein
MLRFQTVRTFVLAFAVLSLVACKGKPKPQAAPGSGKFEKQGSGKAVEVVLPQADGTPPIKTTAPVKPDTFRKLSEMTFPGFNLDVQRLNAENMWVYQKTIDHPVIRASIRIWPCNATNCWPLDVATYKQHETDIKNAYLSEDLRKMPDTQFEIGETDLHGTKMIYSFQLGQSVGSGMHSEFTYTYVLYYNDGNNEIRVLGEYKDDMMASKEAMTKSVPKEDLENTAKAFLDVYTHHWQE